MKLSSAQKDPFHVLSSTKPIVESLTYIQIHQDKIEVLAKRIAVQLTKGIDIAQAVHVGTADTLEKAVQLIFLQDAVNFCFWAEKGKQKWRIEWSKGRTTSGGWYTLVASFQRALAKNVPILTADYLSCLTLKQTANLFRGANEIEIPLLKNRWENLREAGAILKKKYNGQFINVLEEAGFDSIIIVRLLLRDFPSFRDTATWKGKTVYFLKRAQICAQDFLYLKKQYKQMNIKNVDTLTAFADYKIPQMLRHYGVITYTKELTDTLDNYILISKGNRKEIEIRAVTIWCIELIRQKLKKYTAVDIDNALWLISQDQTGVKPYHRTYTIFY